MPVRSTFRIYRQRDEIKTRQSDVPDSEHTHYKAIRITQSILNTISTIIIYSYCFSQSKPCQILVSFQKKNQKEKKKEKKKHVPSFTRPLTSQIHFQINRAQLSFKWPVSHSHIHHHHHHHH